MNIFKFQYCFTNRNSNKSIFLNRNSLSLLLTLIFLAILSTTHMKAQTTCIPPAIGVPYSSGPPKWFDSTILSATALYNRIDDPRWKGSTSITHGSSVTELVFRALHKTEGGSKSLYLSWWIKVNPADFTKGKYLFIGLQSAGGSGNQILLKVKLLTNDVINGNNSTTDREIEVFNVDRTTGVVGIPLAIESPRDDWINKIHVWAYSTTSNWAVHINLPLNEDLFGSGVILPDAFIMWYEVLQKVAGSEGTVYTWPVGQVLETDTDEVGEPLIAPLDEDWQNFSLSSGPYDLSCSSTGITIDPLDIGTNHGMGAGYISKDEENTFYAKPTNKTGGDVDVGKVHARFRIANWGTQPYPYDIPDAETELWKDIRGLEDVTQDDPPDPIANNDQWNITGTWELNPEEQTQFNGTTRSNHQCMLVELSGPRLEFIRSSVHRNMNFVSGSKFREYAQVNVVGLPPIEGKGFKRNVYLYVQTFNMPSKVVDVRLEDKILKKYPKCSEESLLLTRIEKITKSEPTYIVHGYYDTGRRVKIDGKMLNILRPMTSFGYFVQHQGELTGWKHNLEGAEKIAPNFYKLAVDSVATISTTIEAIEKGHIPWWIWILIILLVCFIVLILKRCFIKKPERS
jgi:hypothetical protein